MKNNFVMVITGPPGSGKTTLAKMASNFYNCVYISGDEISKKLFPDTYKDIEKRPKELKILKDQLLKEAKGIFDKGESVVVDYIILGEEYIKRFGGLFGKRLIFKVIFPSVEEIIERDKKRECWISGEDTVKRIHDEYEKIKLLIGADSYIDNAGQTPEETFEKYLKVI